MGITKKAIKEVSKSIKAKANLMIAFDFTEQNINKMLERNDIRLTTPIAVKAIMESTGLTEEQILEPEVAKA